MYWIIFRKDDFFEVLGNSSPPIKKIWVFREKKAYWLILRKGDFFEVVVKNPSQRLGFFFAGKGVVAQF